MAHLLLSLPNGKRKIIECRSGQNPDEVAESNGTRIYDYCASREEAERRMVNDPNGKALWI